MIPRMQEQFAGWRLYDHAALCLDCKHVHLIPKAEQVSFQPWFDWLTKHKNHITFILKESELSALGIQHTIWKHNADVKIAYAASAAYTLTATGLATSTTLLGGRESSSLSNASNKYLDILVGAKVTTGTSPTTAKAIELHAVAAQDDTPNWPDVFDGTDSAETITSADIKNAVCRILGASGTDSTSDRTYPLALNGLRALFGGDALPIAHVLFLTHSTAVNLNATASNHAFVGTPVYNTVV
jgi:hypothetical protein